MSLVVKAARGFEGFTFPVRRGRETKGPQVRGAAKPQGGKGKQKK